MLAIDFPLDHIRALVVTHVHIDHVGRIPYLLAAGFDGPILCSPPSALMLPEVLEHALADGGTVIVPAFSIGRTQELLYEIEDLIWEAGDAPTRSARRSTRSAVTLCVINPWSD